MMVLKDEHEAEEFFNRILLKCFKEQTELLMEVISSMKSDNQKEWDEDLWVDTSAAKKILKVKSNQKMQRLRDERDFNGIIISENGRKFLYYKPSLFAFLKNNIS